MVGFRASKHSLLAAFDRKKLHDVIARSHVLQASHRSSGGQVSPVTPSHA